MGVWHSARNQSLLNKERGALAVMTVCEVDGKGLETSRCSQDWQRVPALLFLRRQAERTAEAPLCARVGALGNKGCQNERSLQMKYKPI